MLVKGVNDDEKKMKAIAEQLEKLRFDRVDINTPVRPPIPERGARPCDEAVLARALALFGPKAKAIGTFQKNGSPLVSKARSFTDVDKKSSGDAFKKAVHDR